MHDQLTEDSPAPGVVLRRGPGTELDVRPGDGSSPALVGLTTGTVWARAEAGTLGVDLGHGALNVVVRSGTVLLDAQAGTGLLIVLRGEAEVSSGGAPAHTTRSGQAVAFDGTGQVGPPMPVDPPELARDPFVSLNLVLDALSGVPIHLVDHGLVPPPDRDARPVATGSARREAKRLRGRRARG